MFIKTPFWFQKLYPHSPYLFNLSQYKRNLKKLRITGVSEGYKEETTKETDYDVIPHVLKTE